MLDSEDGLSEDDVDAALKALAAAQKRAAESGRTIVLVENGKLVRKGPHEYTVLQELPARKFTPRSNDSDSRAAS